MSSRLSASRVGASKNTSVAGTACSSARRALARALPCRQKPCEQESVGGQSGARERRQECAGAGQARHAMATRDGITHQLVAWIGDERRAGIADERNRLARCQLRQDARALSLGIVLVIGAQRLRNREVREQGAAVACVLAVEHVGPGKDGERPQGDVAQIADRRRHEVEAQLAAPASRAPPAPRRRGAQATVLPHQMSRGKPRQHHPWAMRSTPLYGHCGRRDTR